MVDIPAAVTSLQYYYFSEEPAPEYQKNKEKIINKKAINGKKIFMPLSQNISYLR